MSRLAREKDTLKKMVKLFCQNNHSSQEGLCQECNQLLRYAIKRVDNCHYGEEKPVCGKCEIHCYKSEMREKVIEIMRYAGPRMLFKHPILAVKHLIDGFRY
ncbi:nitrous oxide-stimulated promoter family protein [Natroniella sulfidigena]|uniref:nitrous oxide-stimulated promoter family protein n=1 Tax=Natroniella sulfidigena TaxID=723921 RepID=UPI00200B55B7|nr:nitrous oxide-stimulated promoter family protein [Natroniella sulfidigena]MCK8817234.1 nitrous oxide-stimulated promoter family protein [Natroniella sulfidigena]